jgi:hypothetical protein
MLYMCVRRCERHITSNIVNFSAETVALQTLVSEVKAFESMPFRQILNLAAAVLCKQLPSTNITLSNCAKTLAASSLFLLFVMSLIQLWPLLPMQLE